MINETLEGESSLSHEFTSRNQKFASISVSKRLVRSVSQKLKTHTQKCQRDEDVNSTMVSMRCLTLYGRGGGCKVGAETCDDFGDLACKRRLSVCEQTRPDCFSYDKFWKKNFRKDTENDEKIPPPPNSRMHLFLPDDILEMCFMRLPITSLMNARLVCKRWKSLTTTPRFMLMRQQGLYQSPWLFLFGTVKDGYCSAEIHALDVSLDKWHKIDSQILQGRFMFSVASMQDRIYIVGGCSSLTNLGKVDKSSFKTHKGVIVFCPLTKSWHKSASMKFARSSPIVGICEVSSDCLIKGGNQQNRHDRRFYRSRTGGVSDVYEDPHRLSIRRQRENFPVENETSSSLANIKTNKFVNHKSEKTNIKDNRKFVIIVVGGLGSWDEPLESGEIYDSVSNKWVEIKRLPVDFGIVCSGVVCNDMFYVYSETDRLAAYDIERGFWIGIQTSTFPPRVREYHPKLVSSNGRLLMLSVSWCEGHGQIGRRNKAVRKLWELDLMFLTWTEVSVHPDAPMDWNAAFVDDRNLIFGVEMFKIFGQVLDFLTVCDVSSDTGTKWSHISRNHVAHELDASSCVTKTMAVLHL